jgi:hypothetical protein
MSRPSRISVEKALIEIVDAFALVVDERVPGKCVTVEWPNMVESVTLFDRNTVRVLEYLRASGATPQEASDG